MMYDGNYSIDLLIFGKGLCMDDDGIKKLIMYIYAYCLV